jgi:CubicO group peptidase (beta-lactamase class C family)
MRRGLATVAALLACGVAGAVPAHAAKSCSEPGASWERAQPAEVGLDAQKLQAALDYGSQNAGFALRVYRHGCLVGEDRGASANRNRTFESYSMAKSVTSLIFGRAMTLGLISPDDPVGALVPEADGPHGDITMHDLLTMTAGVRWNGWRDYNVFTMPDRVRDALTLEMVHEPGSYFEYAQSTVALLAEAIGRAVGEDVKAFGQRELMDPLGIRNGDWSWSRDPAGHVQGFYGVNMRPDDYGRLGDLLRRGGMWRGKRLLSREYVSRALEPSRTNGCYGWLIWLNSGSPCIGPRVTERSIEDNRDFPDLPPDLYHFSGLFGQLVTVFPSQDIEVVRLGQDPGLVPAGGQDWEHGLYTRVLAAVTDQKIERPADPPKTGYSDPNADAGFQNALAEPDQYSKGVSQDPLPPAGPERARAALLAAGAPRATKRGTITASLTCPYRSPGRDPRHCVGAATLTGRRLAYDVKPGWTKQLRVRLTKPQLRRLKRRGRFRPLLTAVNRAPGGGTGSQLTFTVLRPRSG